MSTDGATLTQTRRRESGVLDASWSFLEDIQRDSDNFALSWVRLDSVRYEAAILPWRLLYEKNYNGIVLTYEIPLFAVRESVADEWLPMTYLTLPMLRARRLEVGYSIGPEAQRQGGKQVISLDGFREVAKWCGRELLKDKLDIPRVQELVK